MSIDKRYSPREVRLILSRLRQYPVPDRTWNYWKRRLGITPDNDRRYGQIEVELLKGLVKALKAGKTIDEYLNLEQVSEFYGYQQTDQYSEPIETTAVPCE